MEYTFIKGTSINSTFIQEEFFPAIVEFSSEELNNQFLEFNYKDTDMFELSVTPTSKELKRFTLTLCNHFSVLDEYLSLPDYESGNLIISGPNKTECTTFSVIIFNDGLQITTSNECATIHLKCGQLIFGLTTLGEVTTVYICDLDSAEIEHVKKELNT